MEVHQSLADTLDNLKKRGYEADFATETFCLYCGDLDLRLYPGEFNIDEVYRFTGNSNPDDNALVYAISSSTGLRGILVDKYDLHSKNLSFGIAKKLRDYHEMNY